MNYAALPEKLTVGMKLACPKVEPNKPEVVEIVLIDDQGYVILRRENGNAISNKYNQSELAAFDYMLVKE